MQNYFSKEHIARQSTQAMESFIHVWLKKSINQVIMSGTKNTIRNKL